MSNAPILGSGWLSRNLGPHPSLGGFPIDRAYPTRWEEYAFILETIDHQPKPMVAIDAGSGCNPEIHLLPYILGNVNCNVVAVDHDPAGLTMRETPAVARVQASLTDLGPVDAHFDAWICVSTMEHLEQHDRELALCEAFRVLRPNGLLLMTTDWIPPEYLTLWVQTAGFVCGPILPFTGERLDPHISWIRAQKPGEDTHGRARSTSPASSDRPGVQEPAVADGGR